MKSVVLKIDVDTYRGTKEGVPPLVELLKKYNANATFLFSLGPDHTGRALRRIFRPGFFQKVQRTSVLSHYGLKTLMYGVLLPGPHIGKSCRNELLHVKNNGFEVGVHTYDHVKWQDFVVKQNEAWTANELKKAYDGFLEIFGEPPTTYGAAGWQMNEHGLAWLAQHFSYTSDTRDGEFPFYPQLKNSKGAMQLPTTLPTMDELIGSDGVDENNIGDTLAKIVMDKEKLNYPYAQVFTLHAELEGMKLKNAFEVFLTKLKSKGYRFLSMKEYYESLDKNSVPSLPVTLREIPGRSGLVSAPHTNYIK